VPGSTGGNTAGIGGETLRVFVRKEGEEDMDAMETYDEDRTMVKGVKEGEMENLPIASPENSGDGSSVGGVAIDGVSNGSSDGPEEDAVMTVNADIDSDVEVSSVTEDEGDICVSDGTITPPPKDE